jgi:endonuclease/exonuclease/phosphatase family metal-dependent hydrolase
MKIVSFNIRCAWMETQKSAINSFVHRAGLIYEKLRSERPEIVAFQEVTAPIFGFLKNSLSDVYDFQMFFRSANFDGEGLAIATLKDSMVCHSIDSFWLSPTPRVPGSRFPEQSPCPRVATVGVFREVATGRLIRVCDTHLDHISDEARLLGINLLLKRLSDINEEYPLPTVLLGDFNARPESAPVAAIKTSPLGFSELTESIPVTFHDYGTKTIKIDYIFGTGELADALVSCGIWDDCKNGVYLSDHYPVFVEV